MSHAEQECFLKVLEGNRVIPAVRDETELKRALLSNHTLVFILFGDILTLDGNVHAVLRSGKMPFIHLDMLHGFANNPVVLDYFFRHFKRECGIITTKSTMAKRAMELGIRVVQRYFMLDSLSVESAVEGLAKLEPDAIEILPGILPRIITHLKQRTTVPIIAGGLIQTVGDVEKILSCGAAAVSTTRHELWTLTHASASLNPKPLVVV